jgi:hypothetical protein
MSETEQESVAAELAAEAQKVEAETVEAEKAEGETVEAEKAEAETAEAETATRGRKRQRGTRVVTLELSRSRIERLVAIGLLDDGESDDQTISAAIKALIDGEATAAAASLPDDRELCVPVMLDPEEQAFLVESQLLPIHGPQDGQGMARVFKKLLGEARAHWLQFNAPRRSAPGAALAAAPLGEAELARIRRRHRATREVPVAAVRLVPREAQKAYLRAWRQTGQWPREWGPLPDEPGTVIIDDDVRAIFGLDPIPRRGG